MKKIIMLLVSVLVFGIVSAQTINAGLVPEVVKNKMQTKYPEAKGLSWTESAAGFVEANFTLNKQKCNAIFSTAGEWISTDFTIAKEEFPKAASDYLTGVGYTDKVTRYYRSVSEAKGTQFSADAKINEKMYTFIFDQDGKIVMRGLKK